MDFGGIMAVMTSPVALLTVTALGGVPLGAALDRLYLRAMDRIDDAKAARRRRQIIDRIMARGGVPDRSGWASERARVHESTDDDAASAAALAAPVTVAAGVPDGSGGVLSAHHGPCSLESVDPECGPQAPEAAQESTHAPVGDLWAAPVEAPAAPLKSTRMPPESRLYISTPRLIVAPHVQVADFLDYVRANDLGKCPETGRMIALRTHDAWVAAFLKWTARCGIEAAPAQTFLKLFKASPGVEYHRPRLKRDGRVIKLDTGAQSPARKIHYRVVALPPSRAERPAQARRRAA